MWWVVWFRPDDTHPLHNRFFSGRPILADCVRVMRFVPIANPSAAFCYEFGAFFSDRFWRDLLQRQARGMILTSGENRNQDMSPSTKLSVKLKLYLSSFGIGERKAVTKRRWALPSWKVAFWKSGVCYHLSLPHDLYGLSNYLYPFKRLD